MSLLYVHEIGPKEAPAILFLHGLGLSHTMWHPQFERLGDFYHCLAPDLPECGNSVDIGPFSLKEAAQLVISTLREYVPKGVTHVVGLSLGGAVALQMLYEAPEVVDHLMISGMARTLPPPLGAIGRLNGHILHLASHERLAEFLLEAYDNIPHAERRLLLADLRIVKPEAIGRFLQAMTNWKLLYNAQTPILAAAGRLEAFVTQQAVYEMKRRIPCVQGALIPGASHFWNLEFPDLFTQTVRAWIEDEPLPNRVLPI
jgi:pimeloyl-ACP methyl ester carboxylesterase